MTQLPDTLTTLLQKQYSPADFDRILAGYQSDRITSFRVNPLKSSVPQMEALLQTAGLSFTHPVWYPDAFCLPPASEAALTDLPAYEEGAFYLQSLSSMLPPLLLEARPGETVLDMAAAPGGKTTQIAALTGNAAQITACEMNAVRAERLSFNLKRQGASRVFVMVCDARKLDDAFSFDRILLDAPCTGSGTILFSDGRDFRMTDSYLQKTVRTQQALLKKALGLLKKGHEMVYSTCSILSRENEEVLRAVLPACGGEILPIDPAFPQSIPTLPTRLPGTLCVCPTAEYEGFFAARIRKVR